jgi:hypothetical protein
MTTTTTPTTIDLGPLLALRADVDKMIGRFGPTTHPGKEVYMALVARLDAAESAFVEHVIGMLGDDVDGSGMVDGLGAFAGAFTRSDMLNAIAANTLDYVQ